MNDLGTKIAGKRKDLGMTQTELAERLCVSRQTVSRWEAGTVYPDIEKISDIASLLGVSCDYLLRDEIGDETPFERKESRLLRRAEGKRVKLWFFDGEADADLANRECRILSMEGNWMKAETETKKGRIEKLIPVSSVLSIEILSEDE